MPYSDVSASFVGGELGVLNIVRCWNSSVPCLDGDIAGYIFFVIITFCVQDLSFEDTLVNGTKENPFKSKSV